MHSKQPVPKACPCICLFPAFMYTPDNGKLANSVPMQLMCDMAQIQRQPPNALLCSCADGRAVASNQVSGSSIIFQVGREKKSCTKRTTQPYPVLGTIVTQLTKIDFPQGLQSCLELPTTNPQECPTSTCHQNIDGCSCAAFLPTAHAFHAWI